MPEGELEVKQEAGVVPKTAGLTLGSTGRPKKTWAQRIGRFCLLGVGPLVIALAGGAYIASSARYVTTENAYIKAEKIAISTEVSGHVAEVLVTENEIVEPGQLLFRLDDNRLAIAVEQKEANVETARRKVEGLRALYRQKGAERKSAGEELAYYDSEIKRAENLRQKGHMSHARFEEIRRDRLKARHSLEAMRQDIDQVLAELGGDPAAPVDSHPEVKLALAELQEARLNLSRTAILAPAKAIVSNHDLQVGEYVELGEPVFSLVDVEHFWIEANMKETDLTHVREGQAAKFQLDAYPDRLWRGQVVGIAPATGAEFAILPPQNASGNWVKVVQRIPVRLEIIRAAGDPPLRSGMSAKVEIDTRVEMELPGPFKAALAWVRERQEPFDAR